MCAEMKPGAVATAHGLPENSQQNVSSSNISPNSTAAQDFTGYLLARSRVAVLSLRTATNEITANAIALKAGWLTADEFCAELDQLGLLPLIEGST